MEIGGFFHFPSFDCIDPKKSVFHYLINSSGKNECLFIRDGRQAIKIVLQQIKNVQEKKCYLPAYLCHSILQPFREMGLNIQFYDHTHPLIQNIENICDSVILIIDYFGTEFYSTQKIKKLLAQGNYVILDITQSILDKTRLKLCHKNLYYISSLRKIFPIPDGAAIFHSNTILDVDMDDFTTYVPMLDAMILKNYYINQISDFSEIHNLDLKKLFLSQYIQYEENKDKQSIQINNIPLISLLILSNLDYNKISERRRQNLLTIYEKNRNNELFLFDSNDIKSPFMVPLTLQNNKKRENLKNLLIKNNIYSPIHWDIKGLVPGKFRYEHQLSSRILSITIDQRYTPEDMTGISNILNQVTI